MGPVKDQVQSLSNRLEEKFRLREKMVVPHITLAGPFSTEDEDRLVRDFTRVCTAQENIPRYEAGGYGFFSSTRVVYVAIEPDEPLRRFRYELSRAIAPYCTLRAYDRDDAAAFRFHATIAMKLDWLTFQRIRWHFRNQEPVVHRPHPIRATLLRDSRILCEYDFVQKRMLTPAQAQGRATRMRHRDILRAWEDTGSEQEP
jgi:2'-5' RNA ligase